MKLLKAMATVAGLTGLSRIFGFLRDILTAAYLGAGPVADAFFVAFKLPNFFRRVTAEGAFSVSFVPLYSGKLHKDGEVEANTFAANTFSVMLSVLVPFTLLAMLCMPWIISVIAPGFQGDPLRHDLAVELSRITFPYLLMMSLTSLMGGIMNAHDKFAPFAAAPIFFNLCQCIALYFFANLPETPGHALAWGVFAAGIVQFTWLCYSVRNLRIPFRFQWPVFNADIKKLFKLMGPGVVGAGVVHVNLFVDLILASFLATGSISYLFYADRLNQLPLGMVGIAVGTALLPMLSKAISRGDHTEAKDLFNRALEVCLILSIPAAVALMVAAEPLIRALFERGEFTAENSTITAHVLMGYALGLPAYICCKVFSTAFWARQDTTTPVKVAIICALLNIVLAVLFIQPLGVAGISLATGICGWLQFILLKAKLKDLDVAQFDARLLKMLPRLGVSACLMGLVLAITAYGFKDGFAGDTHEKVLALAALVGGGLITYALAAVLTGTLNIREFKQYFLTQRTRRSAEGKADA